MSQLDSGHVTSQHEHLVCQGDMQSPSQHCAAASCCTCVGASCMWLQQVPKGNYMQLFSDDIDMMEDLMIANNQVVDSARSVLKNIQNIRGSIEAIMTSRLNNSLSILTVLTILLTVPLVIASFYGMNIDLPFQDSKYAFAGIIVANVVILAILAYIFNRKNWF